MINLLHAFQGSFLPVCDGCTYLFMDIPIGGFPLVFIGLIVFTWTLPSLAARFKLMWLAIASRWLRWGWIGYAFAYFLRVSELSFRPDWVHFVTGLAVWFGIETLYNWMGIKALSRSDIPLFPKYSENTDGDDWPAEKKFIEVKEWIRESGFQRLDSLKAEVLPGTFLRSSIYEDRKSATRLQVLFFPHRRGVPAATYSFLTESADGSRIMTDNQFLPYGGYYPSNWTVRRFPLVGSIKKLASRHRDYLQHKDIKGTLLEDDALAHLSDQHRILEKVNIEQGFFLPRHHRDEHGRITSDGCFRLWKEMWLLAYFGRPVSG